MILGIELLAALVIFAVVISIMLAPLESLTWWAGWYGTREDLETLDDPDPASDAPVEPLHTQAYLVYLSGIGGYSRQSFMPEEQYLLEQLAQRIPHVAVVDDIYPYSVTNTGLIENRVFSRFWNWVLRQKQVGRSVGFLINARNFLQVLVAADSRYGPLYAHGIADVILSGLKRRGYRIGSNVPIYLLGYSGGGEMSITAVGPLARSTDAPITVISLGGVFSSDPNFGAVTHFYHLHGDYDRVHLLGPLFFPGRWRWMVTSTWNRARHADKVTFVRMGPMTHTGIASYLDPMAELPDGTRHLDATIRIIQDILAR